MFLGGNDMKIVTGSLLALAALAGCAPYPDQPVASTYPNSEVVVTPPTVVTYQPVAAPVPVYPTAPATVYATPTYVAPSYVAPAYVAPMPTQVVVPGNTYVVQRDPPRDYGVSAGTSPQPVLTPNQKEQDKTMSSK
jgi:hypothetical protein